MESHEWSMGQYRHFDSFHQYNASTNSSEESDCSPPLAAAATATGSGTKTRSFPTKACATLQPMLPPCRVCGERASGFHYGVNTCEACKGFFRRSLQKTEKYKCLGDGNCEVISSRRGTCSACRYNKCIAVGMSKEAIKTGRYTHEKRAKDIAEVKRLERLQIASSSSSSPHYAADGHVTAAHSSNGAGPYNGESSEVEQIVHHITSTYFTIVQSAITDITQKENEFLEQKALKESLFGQLNHVPVDEYMKIYEATGIDVDGRRDLIQSMFPQMELRIKRFINFAKAVPGFIDLPMEDQISLIKATRFEVWLILSQHLFNQEKRLYTSCGRVHCIEEMLKLHDATYLDQVFEVNRRIRALNLNYEETCTVAAFVMMTPDQCELTDRRRVETSQCILLNCVLYLLNKLRPDDPMAYVKIINTLVSMRSAKVLHEKEEEKIASQWFDKLEIPPLVYEVWSS